MNSPLTICIILYDKETAHENVHLSLFDWKLLNKFLNYTVIIGHFINLYIMIILKHNSVWISGIHFFLSLSLLVTKIKYCLFTIYFYPFPHSLMWVLEWLCFSWHHSLLIWTDVMSKKAIFLGTAELKQKHYVTLYLSPSCPGSCNWAMHIVKLSLCRGWGGFRKNGKSSNVALWFEWVLCMSSHKFMSGKSQNKSKGMLSGLREKGKTGQADFFFVLCDRGRLLCNTSMPSALLVLFEKGIS